MTTYTLVQKSQNGPLAGFGNLFAKEMGDWWKTRRWLVTFLTFLVVVNGMTFLFTSIEQLAAMELEAAAAAGEELPEVDTIPPDEMVMMVFLFGGLTMSIGAVVITQDSVISERQMGTAEWIASKPASRLSFILSKFAAHAIGLGVVGVLAQSIVAYLLLTGRGGVSLNPLNFVLAAGALYVAVLFFIALTLMLSTVMDTRAAVVGLPIGILLLGQYIINLLPFLENITPYAIMIPLSEPVTIAANLAMGDPTPLLPVFASLGWVAVFIGVALWCFSREEF